MADPTELVLRPDITRIEPPDPSPLSPPCNVNDPDDPREDEPLLIVIFPVELSLRSVDAVLSEASFVPNKLSFPPVETSLLIPADKYTDPPTDPPAPPDNVTDPPIPSLLPPYKLMSPDRVLDDPVEIVIDPELPPNDCPDVMIIDPELELPNASLECIFTDPDVPSKLEPPVKINAPPNAPSADSESPPEIATGPPAELPLKLSPPRTCTEPPGATPPTDIPPDIDTEPPGCKE